MKMGSARGRAAPVRFAAMPDALESVASARSRAEAEMIAERLRQQGISSVIQRSIGGPQWGDSGSQTVYVDRQDGVRARELLAVDADDFSDEELTRLSEQAAREANEP